jgi:membrane-associated phospholipid phosphatase
VIAGAVVAAGCVFVASLVFRRDAQAENARLLDS